MRRVLRLDLLLAVCFFSIGFCVGQSADSKPTASLPVAAPIQAAAPSAQSAVTPQGPGSGAQAASPLTVKSDAAALLPNPVGEALSLYRKGSFSAAIEKYQHILQDNPKSPDAYTGLTRIYLKQGNVSLAADTVTKGLLAATNSSGLHVALGEVYFRQGKIAEAEQEWVNVINSGRGDARAYLGLARVRNAISMYGKGKTLIDKAHNLDPNDPDIERDWAETLRSSERIKYLETYLNGPNNDDAEKRAATQRYLDYLKARANEPRRSCHLVGKVTSTETPLVRLLIDPTHLRGYGLTVKVNDHKANLMLDTGASGILIDRGLAEKAGIRRLSETRISGIGDKGSKSGYVGLASSIKIGELEFQDCPVEVLDKRSVVGEEGLIGADVFEDFLVDVNFPKEKLRLSELPRRPEDKSAPASLRTDADEGDDSGASSHEANNAVASSSEKPASAANSRFHDAYIAPEMKSYTRIFRFGHELLMPTKIGDAPLKLFLLDTGSLGNEITPAAAREITKVHGDSDTKVEGVSGAVNKVYSANKAIIQFSRVRQENLDMLSIDLTSISESTGTEVSGILGFTTLRFLDVKIDYRDGLVDCAYDPKFWGR